MSTRQPSAITATVTYMLVALVLVAACASADPVPSTPSEPGVFVVDASNEEGQFTVWVSDTTGLATGARRWFGVGQAIEGNSVVLASPDTSEVAVGWIGGICAPTPTLTVNAGANGLLFVIRPDEGQTGGACDSMGVFFGVVITFSAPFQQDEVSVEVVR
jgi:hypothetical protein